MLLHFLWFSLLFLSILSSEIIDITTPSPPLSPPPSPPPANFNQHRSSFKPTVAVIVGVVTTIFSVTFLLLLYVKHCKRRHLNNIINGPITGSAGGTRKDSGIDRMVIESLPVFRFGSLRGQKEGLECAVCLNKFEAAEFLKLLPKCNHAFHVQCVDTWLDAHSTCPLCRYRVDPEDILFIHHHRQEDGGGDDDVDNNILLIDQNQDREELDTLRRVSGRHSSAGERGRKSIQIVVESPPLESNNGLAILGRSSLDSSRSLVLLKKKKKMMMKKKKNINNNVWQMGVEEEEPLAGTRKDGLLLTADKKVREEEERDCFERRFSHRIIVSGGGSGGDHTDDRWSDVNRSELLYLRSEMIISDSRRFSAV